ncbi:uncharacterized protein BO80DRAFT_458268 [Aspergillus ibericus CBS 121593]|uniref:S-adenosyl-L-methionine-dependent methyltransferase n=1 Tax=Aspergillus ibericus CBS 121593 TaxID=1448316 RepID=A0A395GRG5_9EURO|nr:hypothetical protein BO80DRAFT_458268 [Aspergillus ibericus CBS 121593]RAK97297.1 hypothetical protein BO80DRAFT_458268 [Aspergillus ibericus CBS 121593]
MRNLTELRMSDPTFRNHSSEQAKKYTEARGSYKSKLIELVLRHHGGTGGKFDTLLDVGCGPGNATRDLALSFNGSDDPDCPGPRRSDHDQAAGLNHVTSAENCVSVPSPRMASTWQQAPSNSHDRRRCLIRVSGPLALMLEFWAEAAKVVKPGGTVALWTSASFFCHSATPNAEEVQKALFRLELDALGLYELPPNRLSRDMYDNLLMPWDVEPAVSCFPQGDFVRHEWDRDGVLTNGGDCFFGEGDYTLREPEEGFDTASMMT